jgi:hypothetical protein
MTRLSTPGAAAGAHAASGTARREDRRAPLARQQLVSRVRGEFAEMPCLSLTVPQSVRLFHLREDICVRVLDTLVAQGVLSRREDGRYVARSTNA